MFFQGYKKAPSFQFFHQRNMATNTLGEFSDGEDDFVFETDENVWERSDPEADDLIRNINEEEILAGVYGNDNNDDLIRNINEEEILACVWGR